MAITLKTTTSQKQLPSRFLQLTYIILFVTIGLSLVYSYSSSSIYHGGDIFQTKETRGERNTEITVPNSTYFCPIQDLKIGSWVNITYDRPPYTPMKGEVHQNTCSDFKPNSTFKTWIWEPEAVRSKGCVFKSFEKESYCRLMKNKTVAIIGDSISMDHFLSLTHLLGVPQPLPRVVGNPLLISQVCNNEDGNNNNNSNTTTTTTSGGGGGGGDSSSSKLVVKRDFFLNSVKEIIHDHFPDVLVLNRGAHYVPNDQLLQQMNNNVFPHLNDWQARCELENKDCLLIWRTTVPGHPDCSQFTVPSNSVEEMEHIIATNDNIAWNRFHWNEFKVQNELVLKAFQIQKTLANLSYEVMDAYHVNILRPDMHRFKVDCLHTVRTLRITASLLVEKIDESQAKGQWSVFFTARLAFTISYGFAFYCIVLFFLYLVNVFFYCS